MREHSFRQGATSWLDELIFRVRARSVLSRLPATAAVLADLGCGYDARFLRAACRTRQASGIAVDLSLDPSLRSSSIRLVEADLCKPLPLADESVDAATSLAVLEHLDAPEVHLAEVHRILRRGGVVVVTTPSVRAKPLLELLAFRLHVIDANEIRDHRHYYTQLELRTLLEQAGFEPASITYRTFAFGMNQLAVAVRRPAELGGQHGHRE